MVKFLIIRFSSIGDIVLTTPLIRNLKQQVEDAEVHFLIKPQFASLLEANPYIDKIHQLAEIARTTNEELRKEEFDYIIDLQNNFHSLNIKRSLKRMYFTVDKLNFKKWILVNLKINKLPNKHIVDRYLDTLALFDIENDKQGLDYFIPENAIVNKGKLPIPFQKGFLVLVLGAKHATKKLTIDNLITLASLLKHPVILIGGPEDKKEGEHIVSTLRDQTILNGCGMWSIHQSASIIEQSNAVITHDTGMMHIAAAFKKKIIAIWGNTIPDFGMYPYMSDPASVNFEVTDLKCRPCSKIGHDKCPKKHFKCMVNQDFQSIANTANELF